MSVCFEIPDALIKGQPIQVFQNQQVAAISEFSVDCGQYNAVTVEVYRLSGQADITVLGAAYEGGQYLLLPDINATQTATNTSKSFDVTVGSRFVKVQLANITGSFTIYVTPYISAGMSQVEASIITNSLSAIQAKTGNLTVTGTLDVSTSGVIKSGQTAYNTGTGFWLEYNGGTPRFSLGNPTGNRLTWDGTSLTITGNLSATTGTIGGWTVGATSLTSGSGANTVGLDSGGTNPAIYAGSATPGSAPFRVTQAGALTATSATITGVLTVNDNSSLSGVMNIGTSGGIFQGTGTFASPTTGLKIYNSGSVGLLEMWNSGIRQVYIDSSGTLRAGGGVVQLNSYGMFVQSYHGGSALFGNSLLGFGPSSSYTGTVSAYLASYYNNSYYYYLELMQLATPGYTSQVNILADSAVTSYIMIKATYPNKGDAGLLVRASSGTPVVYLYGLLYPGQSNGAIQQSGYFSSDGSGNLTYNQSLAVTGSYTALGSNTAVSGILRIPNVSWVSSRNAANTADINLIQANVTDQVAFGANLAAFTLAGNLTVSGAVTIDTLNLATHDHTGASGHGAQIANITGNAATVTGLSVTAGKTLTVSNSLTLTATDGSTLAIGAGGTLASMAYQAASAAAITGGTLAGLTGLAIRDTSAALDVTIAATSSIILTTGRTLTIDMVNTAATIKLGYNLTLSAAANIGGTHSGTSSGTNTGDQTITLTGAVTGSGTGSFATTIATPGTLTVATANSTATAHTHAITSTAIASAAASLLACDANGYLQLVRLGLGVAPIAPLDIGVAALGTYAYIGGSSGYRSVRIGVDGGGYATIQGVLKTDLSIRDLTLEPDGGNVGIGTTLPFGRLHVSGSSSSALVRSYLSDTAGALNHKHMFTENYAGDFYISRIDDDNASNLRSVAAFYNSGGVYIGSSPSDKGAGNLAVAGSIYTAANVAWNLGAYSAATVALDTAHYVAATIGGVAYKLAVVT